MMTIRELVEEIINEVGSWDDVRVNPHRFGGQEFKLDKVEIGHIHRNGMVDIPFTRKVREVLVAEEITDIHHILPDSGWISYYVRDQTDVETALWLYRLSLLLKQRGRARRNPERLNRIEHELATMDLSQSLATAIGL